LNIITLNDQFHKNYGLLKFILDKILINVMDLFFLKVKMIFNLVGECVFNLDGNSELWHFIDLTNGKKSLPTTWGSQPF